MALIFKCDGCGELENKRKNLIGHAGTISFVPHDDTMRDNSSTNHDLCTKCVASFKTWLQSLLVKKPTEE